MKISSEKEYLQNRAKIPLSILFYGVVYFIVKRSRLLDYFAVGLAIIFKVELRIITALILMVILKNIYNSLLVRSVKYFNERKQIIEYLKGVEAPKETQEVYKPKPIIPFSKN